MNRLSHPGDEYSDHGAGELEEDVEDGVPMRNAAEKEIGERKGWIEMCTGSTSKRRTNDEECDSSYGATHQEGFTEI
jgi:hypothetical protein